MIAMLAGCAMFALLIWGSEWWLQSVCTPRVRRCLRGVWRWRAHRRSAQAIQRELPQVVELLVLALTAGVPPEQGLRHITALLAQSPLQQICRQLLHDIDIGLPREEAWQRLAGRARVPILTQFAQLMVQTLQLGTPVEQLLHAQVRQLREDRLFLAERAGAIASQKILLPIVICLLPAYFLYLFGGILAHLLSGGGAPWGGWG